MKPRNEMAGRLDAEWIHETMAALINHQFPAIQFSLISFFDWMSSITEFNLLNECGIDWFD